MESSHAPIRSQRGGALTRGGRVLPQAASRSVYRRPAPARRYSRATAPALELQPVCDPARESLRLIELQEQIHLAAAVARGIRYGVPGLLAAWILWRMPLPGADLGPGMPDGAGDILRFMVIVPAVISQLFWAGVWGFSASVPLAWLYRRLHAHRVGRAVEQLPAARQKKVLFPLRNVDSDVGRIADRLAVDLGLDRRASEVTPCDTPPGRGSEICPGR
jgi:hypothetical protein